MSFFDDKLLLCTNCMCEMPVYPMAGHPKECIDLGCKRCHRFLARLRKNIHGKLELDTSVYKTAAWRVGKQP